MCAAPLTHRRLCDCFICLWVVSAIQRKQQNKTKNPKWSLAAAAQAGRGSEAPACPATCPRCEGSRGGVAGSCWSGAWAACWAARGAERTPDVPSMSSAFRKHPRTPRTWGHRQPQQLPLQPGLWHTHSPGHHVRSGCGGSRCDLCCKHIPLCPLTLQPSSAQGP